MTDMALDLRLGEDVLPLAPVRLPEFGEALPSAEASAVTHPS